jgi:hypothetical protein
MNTAVLSRRAAILLAAMALLSGCQDRNRPPSVTTPDPVGRPLVIVGLIVESGAHTPISGARICWSIRCATSGDDGGYRLETETVFEPGHSPCLVASASGFESRNDCDGFSLTLQRTVVIAAGDSLSGRIYQDDVSGWLLDDWCQRCKRIHIEIPHDGTLVVRVSGDGTTSPPTLTPDTPIAAKAGTTAFLLIQSSLPQNFSLETMLVAD